MRTPAVETPDAVRAHAALRLLFADYEPPLALVLSIFRPLRPFLATLVARVEAVWPGTIQEAMEVWVATAQSQDPESAIAFELTLQRFLARRWRDFNQEERQQAEQSFEEGRRALINLVSNVLVDPIYLGVELTAESEFVRESGVLLRALLGKTPDSGSQLQQVGLSRVAEHETATRAAVVDEERDNARRHAAIDTVFELPDTLRKANRLLPADVTLGGLWDRAIKIAAGRAERAAKAKKDALGHSTEFVEEYSQNDGPSRDTTGKIARRKEIARAARNRSPIDPEKALLAKEEERRLRASLQIERRRSSRQQSASLEKRFEDLGYRRDRVRTFTRIAQYERLHPDASDASAARALRLSASALKVYRREQRRHSW